MKKTILALVAIVFWVALFGATYVVKIGDTLEGIAVSQGVAVEQLAATNSIDQPYIIWVGQVLELPSASQQGRTTTNNEGGSPLLPNSLSGAKSNPNISRRAFVWAKPPSAGGGAGYFWNADAHGYYRYANVKWQPVNSSNKVTMGAWGEIGDDHATNGDWSQTALSFKIGPVVDFYKPGYWLNAWSAKIYYGFRHSDSRDGAWTRIQEEKTLSMNLWIGVHQGTESWFSKTGLSAECTGLIAAVAAGGNNGEYLSISIHSPVKWECSVEQSLYKWGSGSLSLNLGYRHLDGEPNPGKDRGLCGINLQLGWAKFVYELESGSKQKIEAQLSF